MGTLTEFGQQSAITTNLAGRIREIPPMIIGIKGKISNNLTLYKTMG